MKKAFFQREKVPAKTFPPYETSNMEHSNEKRSHLRDRNIRKFTSPARQQKEYLNKINHLTHYDYLTDLPNRSFFNEKLASLIEEDEDSGNGFSILFMDLDRFRVINNSLGDKVGNLLLRQISQRINTFLNSTSFLARIDGDEFGIILKGHNEDTKYPITIAKAIKASFDEPFVVDGQQLFITVSIGISCFPTHGNTAEELTKNAAIALYTAKEDGKNAYILYSPSINASSLHLYSLEGDLRNSIKHNELALHYQPRVETASGKIISAEALIRWEHPIHGLIQPNRFIPFAEETGFINEITDWVLKQACLHLKQWKKENISVVPISINITAQRFLKDDWKDIFTSILLETNTDPALIELEITETTMIKYEKTAESSLQFLKELGFKIALDDFGTGFSSLSYINKFPIDTVKIDRSFTRNINKSESTDVIIKTLIFMTKGLNMNLVAEGVETTEQLKFLRQQECQEIQGYLFSKPVPADTYRSLLKKPILEIAATDEKTETKGRRKHFRIPLKFPSRAQMTMTSLKGRKMDFKNTEVLIEDIGPGGLKFLSKMHLPVRPDNVYQFNTKIMNHNICLDGKIVWKEELNGVFAYGLNFSIEEKDREHLIKLLNQFLIQLRKTPFVPNSNIIKSDRFAYLKNM
ncbi:EAL domain-containing protein [Oceanobacillus damuensis]|uniref:EAL domain-containing protein n=1 Tax=Oceanobacillus damuensis TaxID=937928 RepID=UPI00082AE1E8|nr:EAL domain-containing protein [Oceanobacillus damuensis]